MASQLRAICRKRASPSVDSPLLDSPHVRHYETHQMRETHIVPFARFVAATASCCLFCVRAEDCSLFELPLPG